MALTGERKREWNREYMKTYRKAKQIPKVRTEREEIKMLLQRWGLGPWVASRLANRLYKHGLRFTASATSLPSSPAGSDSIQLEPVAATCVGKG